MASDTLLLWDGVQLAAIMWPLLLPLLNLSPQFSYLHPLLQCRWCSIPSIHERQLSNIYATIPDMMIWWCTITRCRISSVCICVCVHGSFCHFERAKPVHYFCSIFCVMLVWVTCVCVFKSKTCRWNTPCLGLSVAAEFPGKNCHDNWLAFSAFTLYSHWIIVIPRLLLIFPEIFARY